MDANSSWDITADRGDTDNGGEIKKKEIRLKVQSRHQRDCTTMSDSTNFKHNTLIQV